MFQDLYHEILTQGWPGYFAYLLGAFALVNAAFAGVYVLMPGAISNTTPGSFEDAFFFSVQTMATIGYGVMSPQTRLAHYMVALEAFTGIIFVALITGITFAKFSRPTARVLFSAKAVVTPRDGVPHLMFRMANARGNQIVEATLRAFLLVVERTREGETMRRPIDLKLVRERTAVFFMTWTAMHVIDATSPFYGEGAMERLRAQSADIFLSLTGIDETLAQQIHVRTTYKLDDIVWNARFADVLQVDDSGTRTIDYRRFNDVVPLGG